MFDNYFCNHLVQDQTQFRTFFEGCTSCLLVGNFPKERGNLFNLPRFGQLIRHRVAGWSHQLEPLLVSLLLEVDVAADQAVS